MVPDGESSDASVCTFIMIVMKDVLLQHGLFPEEKLLSIKQYKMCAYKQKLFEETQKVLSSKFEN
jgi:hypothetical protein